MPYGLLERDLKLIIESVQSFPEISSAVLFGSRAKGTHKIASDVDLAIKGESITYETAIRLADMLNEEKPLPYYFDVLHYESINEPSLLDHIDRIGIVLYAKDTQTT
ncbi:MAG: nucleotidyltransferase domain-containing protein [Candidatus Methylumidiphilus sp.]